MATAICKTLLTLLTSKIKVHFTGLVLLASQKWVFGRTFGCTSKGYVEGENRSLYRARFACLSKVVRLIYVNSDKMKICRTFDMTQMSCHWIKKLLYITHFTPSFKHCLDL